VAAGVSSFPPGRSHRLRFSLSAALAVLLVISTTTAIRSAIRPGTTASASPATAPQRPSYLVLLVLDGGRPDYLTLAHFHHLDNLIARGTQFSNAFDGILEAETPAGHATIATGSPPSVNGILGFNWAQSDNQRYSIFSQSKMAPLEWMMWKSKVPTIGGRFKARFPKARVVAVSGHKYYAAAPLGGPMADAIMYYRGGLHGRYAPTGVPGHMPPPQVLNAPGLVYPTIHLPPAKENYLATSLALSAVNVMHPQILLINYPSFDWPVGHVFGGNLDPKRVLIDMRGFDGDLGRIEDAYRKAHILSKTLFVITADHGMMPITRWVPSSIVDNAIKAAGTTSTNIAASTGDYIWLADRTKAQAVAQNILNAHNAGIQSVWYLDTSHKQPAYALAGGNVASPGENNASAFLLKTLLDGNQPTVVVFGKEGTTFTSPKTHWKADHGGSSWQSQHVPLILSGPGVRRGATIETPAQLEDIAPTILTLMGVQPLGMSGHVLTDALLQPAASDVARRLAERKQLWPLVAAMQKQEYADTH